MKTLARNLAVGLTLAVVFTAPAYSAVPDARITFSGGSVGFIAGVGWGKGTLVYKGHTYPLEVSGLSVGTIGAKSFNASGGVYNLHHVADIEGTYGAVSASATGVVGGGGIDMTNDKGVQIKASSSSGGLELTAGGSGVKIRLKH